MDKIIAILLAVLFAYALSLWFSLVVWTFNDIRARSQNIITQLLATLLPLVFWVFGLLLYYMLRPSQTLVEAYEHSLEEETLLQEIEARHLCPNCSHRVEEDFQICPACLSKLRRQCHFCTRLLALDWTICPYCGR
jgi:RNA polymerase subunit RPABC4/transcription elongation factor Spt4